MKKTIKICMYFDYTNEFGVRSWHYITTVWGDHIDFDRYCWYLRDSDNRMICCGNVSELHGDGTDEFDVKFKNVVCY